MTEQSVPDARQALREWAEGLLRDIEPDVQQGGWHRVDEGAVHRLHMAAPDLAAAVRELAEQVEFMQARGDEHLDAFVEAVAERDALREQVERLREALSEIAEYGGGDGGDWVECCNIARAALTEEPQP